MKPKLTVRVASEGAAPRPLPVLCARASDEQPAKLHLCHGSFLRPVFERLVSGPGGPVGAGGGQRSGAVGLDRWGRVVSGVFWARLLARMCCLCARGLQSMLEILWVLPIRHFTSPWIVPNICQTEATCSYVYFSALPLSVDTPGVPGVRRRALPRCGSPLTLLPPLSASRTRRTSRPCVWCAPIRPPRRRRPSQRPPVG